MSKQRPRRDSTDIISLAAIVVFLLIAVGAVLFLVLEFAFGIHLFHSH